MMFDTYALLFFLAFAAVVVFGSLWMIVDAVGL